MILTAGARILAMFSNFEEANSFLETLIPKQYKTVKAMRLERISYLLKLLGDPHKKLKFVHIGGTSGKGSTAYFLSKILTAQGYRVGLHISPHLQIVTERMQINGVPMPKEKFVRYMNELKYLMEKFEGVSGLEKPTYFEVTVAISLDYFAREKVDIAVVEVGLGGELDATNVIKPLISIITNVGLDHTDILGKTVQKIARDKAEIIKKGAPVIIGAKQPSVQKVIRNKADRVGSELFVLGEDFNYKIKSLDLSGSSFDFIWTNGSSERVQPYQLSTPALYQVGNASLTLAAIELLKGLGFKVGKEKVYKSLKTAKVPGRFEIIRKRPLIILDGAHNPEKIKALLNSLKGLFPKKKYIFLVAFKKGKDAEKMLRLLIPYAETFIITEFSRTTDMGGHFTTPSEKIEKVLTKLKLPGQIIVNKDSPKALNEAKKLSKEGTPVVVTGSLYLVGEIRDLFFPINKTEEPRSSRGSIISYKSKAVTLAHEVVAGHGRNKVRP